MAVPGMSAEPCIDKAFWKKDFLPNERPKRVAALESAAISSLHCLKRMLSTLDTASANENLAWRCGCWKETIEKVLALKENHQTYVGLRGATGSGKSTLINAILQMKDLLPTQSNKACTAVPVEVAYNSSTDSKELFKAIVEFATAEEWKMELDVLFKDVEAHILDIGDDAMEEDHDRLERIYEALSKLQYVYPHLKSIDDLTATSTAELLAHQNIKKVLGSQKIIRRGQQNQFSDTIMLYITTPEVDRKKFAYWPLVKRVKVFVKAQLLEHGLVLVDLPGGMDSNAARGAIAEKYQKYLDVTCVVVDGRRGIDDKNAHLLVEELLKRDLQMNGVYDSNHLCFILSQYDRDFDAPYYARHNKAVSIAIQPELDKFRVFNAKISERMELFREIQINYDKNMARMEDVIADIKELQSQDHFGHSKAKLKRKRDQPDGSAVTKPSSGSDQQAASVTKVSGLQMELAELEKKVATDAKEQLSLAKRINDLRGAKFHAQSSIVHECNKDRKAKSVAAIRRDFEITQHRMGRPTAEPLPVFCVASNTYLGYQNTTCRKKQGFPSKSDTEIPHLRDWLVKVTFEGRERVAREILEHTEIIISSMQPWVDRKSNNVKLSDERKAELESSFEDKVQMLQEGLSELSLRVNKSIRQLIETRIYSKMPEVERQAAKASQNTIIKFGKEVLWNTHRAINQRQGNWVDKKKGKEHKWNDRLVLDYTDPLVRNWTEVFYSEDGITKEIISYTKAAKQLLDDFALQSTVVENGDEISLEAEILKNQLVKASTLMQFKADVILDGVRSAARESHRYVAAPEVTKFLTPIYDICAAEGGPGHFKRNKETHLSHITNQGVAMHHRITNAIQNAIDEILSGLPSKISSAEREVVEKLQTDIWLFLEHNAPSKSRYATWKKAKLDLQALLGADIGGLLRAWSDKVDFEPLGEPDDLSNFEYEEDDNYHFCDAVEDDGEFIYQSSDEED